MICIGQSLAQEILSAFQNGIEYLRSVIPQLGSTCMITLMRFLHIIRVEAKRIVHIEGITFELTLEARTFLIQTRISAEPKSLTKEAAKAAVTEVAKEAAEQAVTEVTKKAAAEAAKTTLKSTAKTALGCGALIEGAVLSYQLYNDYQLKKDGRITQQEFKERAQRKSVSAACSLTGSTAGAVIGSAVFPVVGTIVGSMVGGIVGGVAGGAFGSFSITYSRRATD